MIDRVDGAGMQDAMGVALPRRLAVVGSFDSTHVGGSLVRAAVSMGIQTTAFEVADSIRGNRLLRVLSWRLRDRRPVHLERFSAGVVAACAQAGPPEVLIATGAASLTEQAIRALRANGTICVNYSTDDPWNARSCGRWHLRALPAYNTVFTPRRANVDDLVRLGCVDVRYLPFGYDEALFAPPSTTNGVPSYDVLFVGGGDPERVAFMVNFLSAGPAVTLVGGYWERFAPTRPYAIGLRPPQAVRDLTAAAKVNLCLVRRANRDGHVMRSFETAAIGGCMLVEDTGEHREIFGADGEAVLYFKSAREAATRAGVLLGDSALRARLATRVRSHIVARPNRYADRLRIILQNLPK